MQAGALGVVLSGIQLGAAIDQYRTAMDGYDGAAQQAAYENLADKTCGVVAGIGGVIASIPGLQLIGLGIWLGATAAQQYTNGNFGRLSAEIGKFYDWNIAHPDASINERFNAARNWTAPRDPLVLDLDGDGIEAVGINPSAPILFDHDGDGTKNATGWIRADDGIVVMDRNGNGLIDSGRELFGDNTVLARGPKAGQTAANGFEALADLDINGDGALNSADAAYAQLRIWQDANQDGLSQAAELKTLAAMGIASINVTGTPSNVDLGNGNTQPFSGSFTRTNGATGMSGVAEVTGSLLLASNNFYRNFTDDPVVTAAAAALPQMRGSGAVRDLREAMSLGNAQAQDLQIKLAAFAADTTRDQQLAHLDALIQSWGATSAMQTSIQTNRATNSGATLTVIEQFAQSNPNLYAEIYTLEQFNGDTVLSQWVRNFTETTWRADVQKWVTTSYWAVSYSAQQEALIHQSYDALKDSVYNALVVQTRLQPYLDAIEQVFDESGIHFDTSALAAKIDTSLQADIRNGAIDLVELNLFTQGAFHVTGYDGLGRLRSVVAGLPSESPLRAELASLGVRWSSGTGGDVGEVFLGSTDSENFWSGGGNDVLDAGDGNDTLSGGDGEDFVFGGGGWDELRGDGGADLLEGGDGNDGLYAGSGDDSLDGGAGDDELKGGDGADVYHFGRGSGVDTIINDDADALGTLPDTIMFAAGIAPSDIRVTRFGDYLRLSINGSTDVLLVADFFVMDGSSNRAVEKIQFHDGTVWDIAAVKRMVLSPTEESDDLIGYETNDVLSGNGGDDTLHGRGGNDVLDGGLGKDVLYGDSGDDFLLGGGGEFDELRGGDGNDTLEGGAGSDFIVGGNGNDTFRFGRGSDRDTIDGFMSVEDADSEFDVIQLGTNILASDLLFSHSDNDLVITINGTQDRLLVTNVFREDLSPNVVDQIIFSDGTAWDVAAIKAKVLESTNGNDSIVGFPCDDSIFGGAGNDFIYGKGGDDYLDGGSGNDTLYGGGGNDILEGGVGHDYMVGENGADTYRFGRGSGSDTINNVDYDAIGTAPDTLLLGDGLTPDDLIFTRVYSNGIIGGNNLLIQIKGVPDNILISEYFENDANWGRVIDFIQFSNGLRWDPAAVRAAVSKTSEASDKIVGFSTADSIFGGGGNDYLYGELGDDVLHGEAGDDTLNGGYGNDQLYGGDDNDTLYGEFGDDLLVGGAGNDIIYSGGGNDVLTGGAGNDGYIFKRGDGQDTITADLGGEADKLNWISVSEYPANVNLTREGTALVLRINGTTDSLTVNSFFEGEGPANANNPVQEIYFVPDRVLWSLADIQAVLNSSATAGDDTLTGTAGGDVLAGGLGNDTYVVDHIADVVIEKANEGADLVLSSVTFALGANVEALTLTGVAAISGQGNELSNNLDGNSAANTLTGGAGDDWINGAGGADTMLGGAGNDVYYVDNAGDAVTENAAEGTDLVQSSVSFTLGANVENLTLTEAAAINATGNALDNVLTGNSGNNLLNGGAGADTMVGGLGNDTYVVDNVGDVVSEGSDSGTDLVQSSITYTLGANLENLTLTGTAAINGTGNGLNNTLTGNGVANTLVGGAGDDVLNGAAGVDTMVGGIGNDTYYVDVAGDVVTELAGEGIDTVYAAVNYTLGGNVENLVINSSAAINATGDVQDNTIHAGAGNNTIDGGAGNDTVSYKTSTAAVTASLATTAAQATGGSGSDTLLNLENLTGSAYNDSLTGNTGNNTLDGGTGNDTMAGGAGNDTYIVDATADVVAENANEGTDMVLSSATYTLGANVENITLTGTAAINATGNALSNNLDGNSAANVLTGGAGDDRLNGAGGADTLLGGTGDDAYYVDNAGDAVTELAGEGLDSVFSSVNYTLGNNLEKLELIGTAAVNGTGNALNNNLDGNSAANTLSGGAGDDWINGAGGADTMLGGAGDDIFYADNAGDVLTELAGEGTDTVFSSVNLTLGANLEKLTLIGDAAINGTGNALNNDLNGNSAANTLTGGAGDDWLNGAGGADTMVGGVGNDVYYADTTGDIVTELANEGIDTVLSSISYTLGNNVEKLMLIGDAAVNGTGNALSNNLDGNSAANTLTGGAGDDWLNGGGGADTLVGGIGDDIYYVDNTGDVVTELAGEGTDLVFSSISTTLGSNLETLVLTGTAAINATGNALGNVLVGNSGANVLAGGAGNDSYILNRGDGADTITENDATAGNTDVALFGAGITTDQLWFTKTGNNLDVAIIGTSDKFSISNWYLGNQYHVEQFKTSDGKTLLDSQVQNLVQAMAAFAPPAAGQTTLASNYATALAPVLAANWQ